jgi:hypothetical protein
VHRIMTQRPYTGSCVKKKSRLQIDGCNVADFVVLL